MSLFYPFFTFRVSPVPQMIASRAPAPHPHTLDPFQEVKEYMLEAEDYAHFLNDKVNVSTGGLQITIADSRAPAPHPHTLDPFQEVKEYMLEAEDYAHFLNDKVNVSTGGLQITIPDSRAPAPHPHTVDRGDSNHDHTLWPLQEGFTVFTSVRTCICPSVTFCFLNILKNHWWNIIKPCKHKIIHIYMTNTLELQWFKQVWDHEK